MSNYKLADGSCSSHYKIGDTFVVEEADDGDYEIFEKSDLVFLLKDEESCTPTFNRIKDGKSDYFYWQLITPTPETKAKRCGFTKSDLKDGMRVKLRGGDTHYACGGDLLEKHGWEPLSNYNEYLTHDDENEFDIIRVTDRDGTVLFERKPESKKVMLELTDEQLEQIKKEYGL